MAVERSMNFDKKAIFYGYWEVDDSDIRLLNECISVGPPDTIYSTELEFGEK